MNKSIYIILSQTGTVFSKILKIVTGAEYNHVSIALEPSLETMYSFGRLSPNNPFVGGFVVEGKNIGTFKRFNRTTAMVLELEISEEKYNAIKYFIEYLKNRKRQLKYNYLGILFACFKLNWAPGKRFYCSQFVRTILACFNVENAVELPYIIKPIDFLKLSNKKVLYTGFLKEYSTEINNKE